ncbi:30S ribosome-binding factor RbfA [Urbifossiella limnaea]|uniref:Ribosome-binding factor A n=1 Tax=Urbifossiella limnaea TaxID=2528023 RepID=A0A517XZ55_9BACT|nr:30S ribosome-binding factor RbfA [Urbifossiella limnaea]QDU22795.1 Ribosome-binding factor A [Urbifossiella limnaea]
MKSHRLARVNEVIRETAANAVLFQLKDPRVKGVTVTRAEVSADLQHAKVYVSVMGSEKEQKLTMYGLASAAGFVQTKIAERLTTRHVPHVTFVFDEGIKKSLAIAQILAAEKALMAPAEPPPADDDADDADDADETDTEDDADQPPPPADGPTDRAG